MTILILKVAIRAWYIVSDIPRIVSARYTPKIIGIPLCRFFTRIQMRVINAMALRLVKRLRAVSR